MKTIIGMLFFASLLLSSMVLIAGKPSNMIYAQPSGTRDTGNANSNATMTTLNVSGSSKVSPSLPVHVAESTVPVPLSEARIQELERDLNETLLIPKQLIRTAAPVETIKPPSPTTASPVLVEPPSMDINGSNPKSMSLMSGASNSTSNSSVNTGNATSSSQNTSNVAALPPIHLYKSTVVAPVDPRSVVDEPSIANQGPIVFYTGNWYAARSTDFGATWKFVSPFGMSDFCCDQDVIYDKNHKIFMWYRQGIASSTTGENRFLLGVSKDALTWVFYSVTPTTFNPAWKNQWFDYPHIALSNNKLWITSNMFSQSGQFVRTVISSWNLAQLSAGTTVNFQYFFETQEFNFTPVQGATRIMYFAVHHSNSQMKLYKWVEDGPISAVIRNIPPWNYGTRSTMVCTSPDNLNWCARSDSRITGGYVTGGIVGFLWNAKQGSGFPFPYVNVATFRESDYTYLSNPKLWNPNFAFMFGYASSNNIPGELGIVTIYGGGSLYPSIAAGVVDGASGTPPPYQLISIRSGNHAASAYGDYIRDRPFSDVGRIWIGSGYTMQGCSAGNCVEPRFYAFGR